MPFSLIINFYCVLFTFVCISPMTTDFFEFSVINYALYADYTCIYDCRYSIKSYTVFDVNFMT